MNHDEEHKDDENNAIRRKKSLFINSIVQN
jgi:hypothetical protein